MGRPSQLAHPCSSWLPLAPPGSSCPPGSSWLPMAPPGSPWLPLAPPPGSPWPPLAFLAPHGSSWLLLAPPGSKSVRNVLLAPPSHDSRIFSWGTLFATTVASHRSAGQVILPLQSRSADKMHACTYDCSPAPPWLILVPHVRHSQMESRSHQLWAVLFQERMHVEEALCHGAPRRLRHFTRKV